MGVGSAARKRLVQNEGEQPRLSRDDAARRIASLLEEHMDSLGLSERQKSETVAKFSKAVARDLRARPKRSK